MRHPQGVMPFAGHEGRVRAQRADTSLGGVPNGKLVLVGEFCLHGETLDVTCLDCVRDLPLCDPPPDAA